MMHLNLPKFEFTFREKGGKKYIFDEVRRKYLLLTPEEWVRQNFVKYLVEHKYYPAPLLSLEMPFVLNNTENRSDIVVYNKQGNITMLVECKSPQVALSQKVFDQAAGYNLKLDATYLVLTNGISHYCCKPDYANRKWIFMNDIPEYDKSDLVSVDQLK
jgi:hypothetical protein